MISYDLVSRGKNIVKIDSQRDVGSFSPVLGGYYTNGTLLGESNYGLWCGRTASNGALRYSLLYDGSSLYTYSYAGRLDGLYVRCVQAS